jgi:hypothetical protein
MNGDALLDAYKLTLINSTSHDDELIRTAYVAEEWDEWLQWLQRHANGEVGSDEATHLPRLQATVEFAGTFLITRFSTTKRGYFCLVPALAEVGDTVAILKGYRVGITLRTWKVNHTAAQRDKLLQAGLGNIDEIWRVLDYGNYESMLSTIGERFINLV